MKKKSAEQVRWDLSVLYSGIEDLALESDISKLVEMARGFNATHKGQLNKTLGAAIADYSEIVMLEHKIMLYLFLKQTENVTDSIVKTKIAKTLELNDRLIVDLDRSGKVIGMEVLDASKQLSSESSKGFEKTLARGIKVDIFPTLVKAR